jgi:glyoxylase-like metal-dependent hydrolase (beta-lactamase superfamily II)
VTGSARPAAPGAPTDRATSPAAPGWATLVRAPNPGPLTLDGTNTWLIGDLRSAGVLVDPGPADDRHLTDLTALADRIALIVLTHWHPDHAEAAPALSERTGVPVRAFDERYCIGAAPLQPDEVVELGGLRVTILHTPGHSGDSVCLLAAVDGERAVLTGDSVLGRGTAVVAHPDGRLADYLDSLGRLHELGAGVPVLPGHGPVLPDLATVAAEYLAHRRERLEQVRVAVQAGARDATEVVRVVYADVDERLWPVAELSVRAQLDYLDTSS